MQLQEQTSRKIGKKEYSKYVIVVKPKDIQKLGWKNKDELEAEAFADTGALVIKKKKFPTTEKNLN